MKDVRKLLFSKQFDSILVQVIRYHDWSYIVSYRGSDGVVLRNSFNSIGEVWKCHPEYLKPMMLDYLAGKPIQEYYKAQKVIA